MISKIGPQTYHFDVFTKKVVGELGIKRFSKYVKRLKSFESWPVWWGHLHFNGLLGVVNKYKKLLDIS